MNKQGRKFFNYLQNTKYIVIVDLDKPSEIECKELNITHPFPKNYSRGVYINQ